MPLYLNINDALMDRFVLAIDHKKMLILGKGGGEASGLIDFDAE
jgi:hypothetical protein